MEVTTRKKANLMIASTAGSALEWYDFFLFAACSVLVFNKTFFVSGSETASTLLALGTFSVGFVARPLGGIVFGILGDRIGRKRLLIVSLLMMGFSTLFMGLLPTFETIGILAPLLLVLLRIIQGIAVGGESTGAILIVAESMPSQQRGFWTSFNLCAASVASLMAAGMIALMQGFYGEQAFVDWAWRIPFMISFLLVILGFWARRRIEESPVFVELSKSGARKAKAPLREALTYNWKQMVQALFVKAGENGMFTLITTFFLLIATTRLGFTRSQVITATFWGAGLQIFSVLLSAHLSDKVGRRPVIITGFIAASAAVFWLYSLQAGAQYSQLLAALCSCFVAQGIICGGYSAYLPELFPTRVRYTALSASYQCAPLISGAIASFVGLYLIELTGSSISVAYYAAAMMLPGLIWVFLSPETSGRSFFEEREDIEQAALPKAQSATAT